MCTLRVHGKSLDVDALVRAAGVAPAVVHRGDRPNVSFAVSDASMDQLQAQIADAVQFLARHGAQLKAAAVAAHADGVVIDFPVASRSSAAQYDRFPADFIAAIGALGIGLEVSRYAMEEGS